ncbi:hypothetical protein [Mycobacterium sp. SMC-14]|uniref:hypothetical protein n=1 Tax=Mycobacterium sp. SMC-14 TaxID=3385968 RepID=UPI00390C4C7F
MTNPAEEGRLMGAALAAATSAADRLQLKSFPLGYNTMKTVKIMTGTGLPPTVVFHLGRIDQLSLATQDFASEAAAEAHLSELATLPRWRLDLTGDPQVREEQSPDKPFTTFVDVATGEEFSVRVVDLEAATSVYVHAAEPPSANWHRDG